MPLPGRDGQLVAVMSADQFDIETGRTWQESFLSHMQGSEERAMKHGSGLDREERSW